MEILHCKDSRTAVILYIISIYFSICGSVLLHVPPCMYMSGHTSISCTVPNLYPLLYFYSQPFLFLGIELINLLIFCPKCSSLVIFVRNSRPKKSAQQFFIFYFFCCMEVLVTTIWLGSMQFIQTSFAYIILVIDFSNL